MRKQRPPWKESWEATDFFEVGVRLGISGCGRNEMDRVGKTISGKKNRTNDRTLRSNKVCGTGMERGQVGHGEGSGGALRSGQRFRRRTGRNKKEF